MKPKNGQKKVKMAPNEKNRTTLFSQTFLVQTIKVFLFFEFEAYLTSYSHFVVLAKFYYLGILYKKLGPGGTYKT